MRHTARWTAWAGVLALALFASLSLGCVTPAGSPRGGPAPSPAGTWRGGSSYDPAGDPFSGLGVRYLLAVGPLGDDRFSAVWEGSYVAPPGYPRMTQYCGELVKREDGKYDCAGMAIFNTSGTFPPDALPQVWVIHGTAELIDADTMRITYDVFQVHDWKSRLFVDAPLFKPAPTPIVEVYRRFSSPGM